MATLNNSISLKPIFFFIAALSSCSANALADDHVRNFSYTIKLGATKQLGVWGAHSFDCVRSIAPSISITKAGSLGTVSQRQGVAFTAQHSLSHTCNGQRFFGTAVNYTAKAKGHDVVKYIVSFSNGNVSVTTNIKVK